MASYKQLLIEYIEYEVSEKSLRPFVVASNTALNRALTSMGIDHQVPVSDTPIDEESVCYEIVDILTTPFVLDLIPS